MNRWCVLSALTLAAPAYAVDGTPLRLIDVFAILLLLLAAALPFLLVGGSVVLVLLVVRSSRRRARLTAEPPEPDPLLPSAGAQISFTPEDVELMQKWGVFFNGTSYRFGERLYDTLSEALTEARRQKATANAA